MAWKGTFFSKNMKWLCAAGVMLLIFIRPQQAVDGAQQAMRIWYTGVAPAMLPFLALMPLITGKEACAAYRKMFSGVMRRLFRLPGAAAPAVIAAMVAGSPGGAAAICNTEASGGINKREAARIALAVSGVSPAWLVMGVGCGILGSQAAGVKLAIIQAAVQLFLLKLLEKVEIHIEPESGVLQHEQERSAVRAAAETTICVCGYMCVFGACGSVAASIAGKSVGTALLAALDLPSGISAIAKQRFPGDMAALGAALGFCGMCIGTQNTERLRTIGLRKRDYYTVRILSALLVSVLCALSFRDMEAAEILAPGAGKIYVISLLAAALCAVPVMIFLSKKLFLNKAKSA